MTEEEFNTLFDQYQAGLRAKERLDIMLDYEYEKFGMFITKRREKGRKVEIFLPSFSKEEIEGLKKTANSSLS